MQLASPTGPAYVASPRTPRKRVFQQLLDERFRGEQAAAEYPDSMKVSQLARKMAVDNQGRLRYLIVLACGYLTFPYLGLWL
jgi:hypothetical protein